MAERLVAESYAADDALLAELRAAWPPRSSPFGGGAPRNMSRALRIVVASVALVAAACGLLPPDYTVHVSNASTLRLTIVVNGTAVGTLAPNSMKDYPPGLLPARPWTVEARMDRGRVIAKMTVEEGAIQDDRALDGTGSYRSVGTRVTLSCGQVWLWVGEPGSGGGPAEGTPGDCDP